MKTRKWCSYDIFRAQFMSWNTPIRKSSPEISQTVAICWGFFSDLMGLILTAHISVYPLTKRACNVCPGSTIMTIYADSGLLTCLLEINLHRSCCLWVLHFVQEMVPTAEINQLEIATLGKQHIIEWWGEWPNVLGWVSMLYERYKQQWFISIDH